MRRTAPWWVFWGAFSVLCYTYIGFPLLLLLRAALRSRSVKREPGTPTVSVIIAAYNEASVITKKLDNIFGLDYPHAQLEVIVASDGSDDGTNELVAAYTAPGLKLLALPRQGKNRTVNDAVAAASGDILVFSDADCMLTPDALQHLVAPFSDPEVGGVGGEHIDSRRKRENNDWNMKRAAKRLESAAGNLTAAEGQIYAIRRSIFTPVPLGVTDDFYISLQVPAAHRRLVFESRAAAFSAPGTAPSAPFQRKVRILTRWLYTTWLLRHLLNPLEYGFYALQLFSHKILRRLAVVPLLLLAISAPFMWGRGWFFKLVTLGQLGLHGAGALGFLLRGTRIGRMRVLSLPLAFDMINLAALLAIVNFVRGERFNIWVPQRAKPAPASSDAATTKVES